MSQYYPLLVDLQDKAVLVVGGGVVAYRKVQTLLEHGALVHIISPRLVQELEKLVDGEKCVWTEKEYCTGDLKQELLVFCCTEKEEVNALVAQDAKNSLRLVNVVDDPEKCSFIVPSILERGDLTIAVSTGGSSPMVARQIRMELAEIYGEEMSAYLALLRIWRIRVKESLAPEKRRLFWERVTDGEVRRLMLEKRAKEAKEVIQQCFQSLLD